LLMTHLDLETVVIEDLQRLLHGCSYRSCYSLPVLLLEFLSYGQLVPVRPVIRSLDPELQLGSVGQQQFIDFLEAVYAADVFEHIRIVPENAGQRRFEAGDHVLEVGPGANHGISIVAQEGRYPQRAGRKSGLIINIAHIQRYALKPAIFKAGGQILGAMLKGVAQEYDRSFFEKNLVSGEFPDFSDSVASRRILISQKMADALNLKTGDSFAAYFVQQPMRMRKYVVSGIYSTGLEEYDKIFALVDMADIQKLNSWTKNQITGFEVMIDDFSFLDEMTDLVREYAGYQILQDGSMMKVSSVKDNNRQLFDWITLTQMNVWVILFIMFFVSFVNMSTALLIIIFEKASMIGLLKAVGASNFLIRKIFVLKSLYILLKGIVIGNVIALILVLSEHYLHFIPLDASSYYVDYVPCDFKLWYFAAIDVSTLLVMSVLLIIPSFAVSVMQPAKVMGFK
ncbi:MAG: ABC transporter permease, partial [Bacteroidales bacterium]|nr:ABC transporter permease [Bacteroidales bacterium]